MRLRCPLILASRSPRRRRLLEQLGFDFEVVVSAIDEVHPDDASPDDIVEHLALAKAQSVSRRHPKALTLAADTIVVHEGQVLGKPADAAEAHLLLRRLSGATHTVYTGIALLYPADEQHIVAHEATRVTFAPLSDEEIDAYVATGSPMDKAGAYGIQDDLGAVFVQRIDGDYYNVVGLPMHRLYQVLKATFPTLLSF